MARVETAPQDAPSQWSETGLTLTFTDCDPVNGNFCDSVTRLALFARNTGASTRNVTVTSAADSRTGRTGDAVVALAAGAEVMFLLSQDGWDISGEFHFDGDHADVEFATVILNE